MTTVSPRAPGSVGEGSSRPGADVFLRPLASPLPLGFFSFGTGMLLLGAEGMGWVPNGDLRSLGLLLAAFVFPLEIIPAVVAFLARDTLGATVLGAFAGSWFALGIGDIVQSPGSTSPALGFFLLVFAAIVFALAGAATLGKPLFTVILGVSGTRALLQGIYEFSHSTGVDRASGIAALVLTALALYGGLALLLEDLRQRPVLPVFRRGAARAAVDEDVEHQAERAKGEAGVREQL